MNRKQIAQELMAGCPVESKRDNKQIAAAIIAGKSFDEIDATTKINDWPETYVWLKNEMAINSAAALMGAAKSDKKTASSRENGKKGGRPKGQKVLIKNQFHDTEKVFSIKSSYFSNDPDFDALTALEYQIYTGGDDIDYAKKKQAEIKKALCGQSDCRCGCKIVKIK